METQSMEIYSSMVVQTLSNDTLRLGRMIVFYELNPTTARDNVLEFRRRIYLHIEQR